MRYFYRTLIQLLAISIAFSITSLNGQASSSDSLLLEMEKLTSDTAKVTFLVQASATAIQQQEFQSALKYAVKGVGFAEQSRSITHQKAALKQATVACYYAGFIAEAAKHATAYASIVQRDGTDYEKAMAYNDLAGIKQASINHTYSPEVEKNLLKALKLFDKDSKARNLPPHTREKLSIYNNLAMLYNSNKDLKLGEKYIRLGLEASKDLPGTELNRMRLLANYADLLIAQNRSKELIQVQDENLALSIKTQNKQIESVVYILWGSWYTQQNNRSRALNSYHKAFELAVAQEDMHNIKEAAQRISTIYDALGKSDSTLHYVKIVTDIDEKIKKADARVQIATAELQQQMEQWKSEITAKSKSQKQVFFIVASGILLLTFVGYFLYYRAQNKYRISSLQMMESELEKQQLLLQRELLEAELESKDKQLTTEVLYKLRKNEMIEETVKKLITHSREIHQDSRQIIMEAVRDLKESNKGEVWEEFELRFHRVHEDFYQKIHGLCPQLTTNERRLAAFLRLNLSTKEISTLTGQSVRAVEVARTRLRKKLNLTNSETGLVEYLATL